MGELPNVTSYLTSVRVEVFFAANSVWVTLYTNVDDSRLGFVVMCSYFSFGLQCLCV